MKSKTWLILLTLTVVLLLAYGGKVTSGYFSDGESSIDNVLRVKDAPLFGTADNFVILAGSTITNTPTSAVTGDIGLSPGTSITGFSLVADSSGQFSTSSQVVGKVYASDDSSPTPANLIIAKNDLTTAYNDAAGRIPTAPDEVTLGGRTLAAGVYHGGTLSLTGTLTLTGDANAVWIFQAESTLDTADDSQIILSGDAKAANVYWKVGSSATLGANSTFKGNIMAYASITVNSGANLEGRVLAQTGAVTLNANTITKPTP